MNLPKVRLTGVRVHGQYLHCSQQVHCVNTGHHALRNNSRQVWCKCAGESSGQEDTGSCSQPGSESKHLIPKLTDLFMSSADICDDDILQVPNIRDKLHPRPSPFCADNNRGGGYGPLPVVFPFR
jgi:hypothetical protein